MEGFSISCTTCRARLRVRDVRIVGQIIPCPKCGSMVLITGQQRSGPLGKEGSGAQLSGTTGSIAPHPRCDSFDNIDRLLDEPVRLPARAASQRWRTSQSLPGEPTPDSPVDDTRHAVEKTDSSKSPTDDAGGDDRSGSEEGAGGADEAGQNAADWAMARTALLRPYLLMGGGAVVGFTLALGLVGWYVGQPGSRSTSSQAATAAAVPDGGPHAESRSPDDRPQEVVAPSDTPEEDETGAVVQQAPETAEEVPETHASPEQEPASESATNGPPQEVPGSDTPPPVPTAPTPTAPPPADDSSLASDAPATLPSANNDLAAFAQWLQNTDAALVPAAPPTSEIPTDDQPAENLASPDEPPVIQPSRPAPPRVDVAARLGEPISALQLRDVPLINALRLVTRMSTIPIRLEPNALGRRNMRANRAVSLSVRDETVRGLLDAVADETGLGWYVDGDHVIVTTATDARGEFVSKSHPIADLTDGNAGAAEALAANIQRLIEYGSWSGQGEANDDVPTGRCEARGAESLRVTHRDTVHYQILVFCEKLRAARGLSPRTGILEDRIVLGSRVADCAALEQSVSVRIGQPRGIDQIAAQLSRDVPVQILVDWPSLYDEGWSPQDTETLFCDQQPLRTMLNDWLRPKGLTWRVIDRQTLEITTPLAVAATHDIEFYRLDGSAEGAGEEGVAVSGKLLAKLGEAAFQPHGFGAVTYDLPSRTLIVSLPQPQQAVASELCR